MSVYAINQTEINIGLTTLKVNIPIGQWVELKDEQKSHPDVEEALRRGWIKISLSEPKGNKEFKPKIELSEPAVNGSKTIPKKSKKEAA